MLLVDCNVCIAAKHMPHQLVEVIHAGHKQQNSSLKGRYAVMANLVVNREY